MHSISTPTRRPCRAALMTLLLSTSSVALACPALAKDAGSASEVEEVVVTAQKRQERLQDVPLAVTALSAEALARQQINDTNNLVAAVPSLTFQQGNNPTNTSFRVRGIGTSLFSQGVEASVSVVVDGVVAARQAQSFTDFADIERIEVLRGPQGTLFGKNATAGVISVVTARPSWDFGGKVSATVAEGDEYRASGTVTGPISDQVAGRLTAYYNDVGGYLPNVAVGGEEGGFKSWGVRGKLEWTPTESLDLLAAADYRKSDADCCQAAYVQATTPAMPALLAPVAASRHNRQVSDDGLTYANSEQQTYSLQADLDLGWGTVTSIAAFQKYDLDNNLEVDRIHTPTAVFVGGTGGTFYAQFNLNRGTTGLEQFSQELRLTSPSGQALTYVVGAYYSDLSVDRAFQRRAAFCAPGTPAQLGTPCTPVARVSLAHIADLKASHLAAFGQAEYEVIEHLKLIGGLRVQHERTSVAGQRLGPIVAGDAPFGGTASARAGQSAADDVITGKAGAQYEFGRDAQAYATYTRGYKGLGFDTEITANFANQKPVQPETVDAYELGFKGQTPDRRMSVSAAIFLADYSNLQVQANRSDAATGLISFVQTNAGSSTTKGFEVESVLRPTDSFTLNASVTYAKARVDVDGLNCPLQFQAAAPTVAIGGTAPVNACYRQQTRNAAGSVVTSAPLQNVRGGKLPASPEWRINLAPTYVFALRNDWAAAAQINISYQSSQLFAIEQDPLLAQKAYTLVDASLAFTAPGDRYRLTVFVKNLLDQDYYSSMAHSSLLSSAATPTDLVANYSKNSGRYVGATLEARF